MERKNLIKAIASLLVALASALLIAFGLQSCQVTRTVTTSAESHQKGDTTLIIQTKTIESYHGSKEK